ncbi:hypothetical protein [Microbacterium sp. 2FI]|uniref:phage tail protein n=1 Tax=Microbacterium sp. 2FI TaxID=2502193 RepID=UPI0010F78CC1|nr:hypothetical protein [Microbacterium sp. 2FI]
MSMPQVGQGAVAVVPTFKGFRTAVTKETDSAAKTSTKGFRSVWSKEGTASGKETGTGFRKAFEGESKGFTDKATRELEQSVSKSARLVSAARLKEQDAAGKVRLAERQLAEARERYSDDTSQVIRAEERLATANRQLEKAQDDTRGSTNDLRQAQANLADAADRTGDQLAEAGRTGARRFSTGFSEVFRGSFLGSALGNLASELTSQIGYAIGAGIRAGISFAIGTVDIASDLNESVNAVDVSYGPIADQILALGDTSAKTFGLSKRELNQYAVQFSSFAKSIAGESGDVAGTFESLLGRATDFASVMNLDVAEALLLFQSGLAGETEPLRRYGRDLSAATVEAFAYANGIAEPGAELTEQQKILARYGALMEQTAEVQGDFANTSDELANQNRINAATWDDLQAKIGTAFLPIASELATVLADDVLPAIADLVEEHGPELAAMFEDAVPALRDLATDVLPLLPDLFKSMADTLPAVIDLTNKLAPAALWVTQWFGGWFTAAETLFGLLSGDTSLAEFLEEVLAIPGPVGDILRAVADLAGGIGVNLGLAIFHVRQFGTGVWNTTQEVIGWFRALPGRIGGFFAGAGDWLYQSGRSIIQGFIDGINDMFSPVGDAVSGLMSWVQGFFPNSPAKRGPFSGAGWTGLKESGSAVMEQWTSGMARPDLTGVLSPYQSTSPNAAGGGTARGGDRYEFHGIYAPTADELFEAAERRRRRAMATRLSDAERV